MTVTETQNISSTKEDFGELQIIIEVDTKNYAPIEHYVYYFENCKIDIYKYNENNTIYISNPVSTIEDTSIVDMQLYDTIETYYFTGELTSSDLVVKTI